MKRNPQNFPCPSDKKYCHFRIRNSMYIYKPNPCVSYIIHWQVSANDMLKGFSGTVDSRYEEIWYSDMVLDLRIIISPQFPSHYKTKYINAGCRLYMHDVFIFSSYSNRIVVCIGLSIFLNSKTYVRTKPDTPFPSGYVCAAHNVHKHKTPSQVACSHGYIYLKRKEKLSFHSTTT